MRRSFAPVVVSAASSAFVIAASVACTVAWKRGVIRSLVTMRTAVTLSDDHAFAFAVENATKMSPDPFPPNPPCRPTPRETRVAMRHYSDAECRDMLADGLADFAGPVLTRNPELAGHDAQLAAAVSLAYNIGPAAYRKSSVARAFSAGQWRSACDAFLKWSYAGGRQVTGLLKRRQSERAICLRGL